MTDLSPEHPRILALDVGDRTIGVAVSDALGIAAHPVETIRRTRPGADVRRIREIITEREVGRIVVGNPLTLKGEAGHQAQRVAEFVAHLTGAITLEVVLWDERLSTAAASRALIDSGMRREKRRKVVDQVAAVFFLQGYLDYLAMNPEG